MATVSRALSNAPDIGAETKQVVRRIADEIGYTPNRAGLRLRTGKTNVVAAVMSVDQTGADHFSFFVEAIARGLTEQSYQLSIAPAIGSDDPLEAVKYVVESQSADAIIIDRTKKDDARVAYLLDRQFPFASFGRTQWSDLHPFYEFNNGEFARNCVARLSERDRKRVLLLSPASQLNCTLDLVAVGQSEAIRLGIDFEVLRDEGDLLCRSSLGRRLFERLREEQVPDAIICPSSNAGIAAAIAAEQAGLVLGETIDIVSKETSPFLTQFRANMLTVLEDAGQAGAFLARAAVQAIEAPEAPPLQRLAVASEIRG